MRYPVPKSTRAKLACMYYELCLLPGLEPRVIRSWADMLSRLLASKPDQKRKLEAKDLQLPWQPLWRALQKELWPKRRLHDPKSASLLHCSSWYTDFVYMLAGTWSMYFSL
jgi:proteasome activator subunit 4